MPRRHLDHDQVHLALDRLFAGDDTLEDAFAVREHLRACPACALRFEELAALDHLLGADPDGPDTFQARYSRAVIDALARTAAAPPEPPPLWRRLLTDPLPRAWAAALALIALLAAGALLAFGPWRDAPSPPPEERFAARGADHDAGAHRIDLFCVHDDADHATPRFTEADPTGLLRCPQHAELKLAVLNASPADQPPLDHLALVAVAPDGDLRWLHPAPPAHPGDASAPVPAAARLRPFGETLRLQTAPQTLRVYAIFSQGPLSRDDLAERLRDHLQHHNPPHLLDLDGLAPRYAVTSRTLEVTP